MLSKKKLNKIFDEMDLDKAIFAFSKGCPYHIKNDECPNMHLKKIRNISLRERDKYIREMTKDNKKDILFVHVNCVRKNEYVLNKRIDDRFDFETDIRSGGY